MARSASLPSPRLRPRLLGVEPLEDRALLTTPGTLSPTFAAGLLATPRAEPFTVTVRPPASVTLGSAEVMRPPALSGGLTTIADADLPRAPLLEDASLAESLGAVLGDRVEVALDRLPPANTSVAINVGGVASETMGRASFLEAPLGFRAQVTPLAGLQGSNRWVVIGIVVPRDRLNFLSKFREITREGAPTPPPTAADGSPTEPTLQARPGTGALKGQPGVPVILLEERQVVVAERPAPVVVSTERTSDATPKLAEPTTSLPSSSLLLTSLAATVEPDRSVAMVVPHVNLFVPYLGGPVSPVVFEGIVADSPPNSDSSAVVPEDDPVTFPTQLPESLETISLSTSAALLDALPFDLPQLSLDIDAFFASLTGSGIAESVQTYARYGPWLAVLCATGFGLAHRWDKLFKSRSALAAEFPLQPDGFFPDEER